MKSLQRKQIEHLFNTIKPVEGYNHRDMCV